MSPNLLTHTGVQAVLGSFVSRELYVGATGAEGKRTPSVEDTTGRYEQRWGQERWRLGGERLLRVRTDLPSQPEREV